MGPGILVLFALVILWLVLNFIFGYFVLQNLINTTRPLLNSATDTLNQLDKVSKAIQQAPSVSLYNKCVKAGGTTCANLVTCNVIFNDLNPNGSSAISQICEFIPLVSALNCPQCQTS